MKLCFFFRKQRKLCQRRVNNTSRNQYCHFDMGHKTGNNHHHRRRTKTNHHQGSGIRICNQIKDYRIFFTFLCYCFSIFFFGGVCHRMAGDSGTDESAVYEITHHPPKHIVIYPFILTMMCRIWFCFS